MSRLLQRPMEPEWLDLGFGVELQALVMDPVAEMAAQNALVASLRAKPGDSAAADLEADLAHARRTVSAWRGITDDEGVPLPCTPESIDAAFRQGILDDDGVPRALAVAYRWALGAARERWRAEGNASAVAPNGIGDATAEAAIVPDASR